jgi:hypothetical protein
MPQIVVDAPEVKALSFMMGDGWDGIIPWQAHEDITSSSWKGKGKETSNPIVVVHTPASSSAESITEVGDTESEVQGDYTEYEPPTGLRSVQDDNSEIITQIVQQSIEVLKRRISEEKERKRKAEEEEEEAKKEVEQAREENAADKGNDADSITKESLKHTDENFLNDREEEPPSIPKYRRVEPSEFTGAGFTTDEKGPLRPLPTLPPKSKKHTLRRLLRRFNNTQRGESSAQGAARHGNNNSTGISDLIGSTEKGASAVDVVINPQRDGSPRTSLGEEET